MFSFYVLIFIYSILTFILTFYLLRYSLIFCLKATAEKNKDSFTLMLLLSAVILPIVLNIFNYYDSFVNPDSYTHILHVRSIMDNGSIPDWAVNAYYQPFPVFSLIISTISLLTSLHFLQAYMLSHIFFVFLSSLCFFSFIKIVGKSMGRFTVLIAAILLTGNTYVYGYFNIFVPSVLQVFAIWMLLLLWIKGLKVPFITFLIGFSLIHFFSIPTFLLTSSMIALLNVLNSRLPYQQSKESLKPSISSVLPLVIWLTYLFQSYAVQSLYGIKVSFPSYLTEIFTEHEVSLTGGFSRPLAAINAIGPALVIGIPSAWTVYLFHTVVKHKKLNKDDIIAGGISLASLLMLPSAFFFIIRPVKTIAAGWARYTLVACLFFLGCASIFVLQRIIESLCASKNYRKPSIKLSLGLLLILLFLAPVGGLTDPFTFKTKDDSLLLNSSERTELNMMAKFLLGYFSWNRIRFVGETSAVLYLKNSILYLNNSLQVDVLRTGMKGTPYYMDITFDDVLNKSKCLHGYGFIIISGREVSNASSLNIMYSGSIYKLSQN